MGPRYLTCEIKEPPARRSVEAGAGGARSAYAPSPDEASPEEPGSGDLGAGHAARPAGAAQVVAREVDVHGVPAALAREVVRQAAGSVPRLVVGVVPHGVLLSLPLI